MRRPAMLSCLALACTLHGDGERASETRVQPYFNAVEVFDTFAAKISVDSSLADGNELEISVSGDANALGRLFAGVHGEDTLSVGVDPNHLTELELVPMLEVRVARLVGLFAADHSEVAVSGTTAALAIDAQGDARVTVTDATELTVSAIDRAALVLAGDGPTLALTTAGTATVDAGGFHAQTATVDAQGSGAIVVCADSLTVTGPGETAVERRCSAGM